MVVVRAAVIAVLNATPSGSANDTPPDAGSGTVITGVVVPTVTLAVAALYN
jgi:hypothetical protein